jgi:hypothetical protein
MPTLKMHTDHIDLSQIYSVHYSDLEYIQDHTFPQVLNKEEQMQDQAIVSITTKTITKTVMANPLHLNNSRKSK